MQKKYPVHFKGSIELPSGDVLAVETQHSLNNVEFILGYRDTHGLMDIIDYNTERKSLSFRTALCPE